MDPTMTAEVNHTPEPEGLDAWWQAVIFDGKDMVELRQNGELCLKSTPLFPSRTLATLTHGTADATLKALLDKHAEVRARVEEVAVDWEQTEDKLKLAGKVARLRDYLLQAIAIGDFIPLIQQAYGWHAVLEAKMEENHAAKKLLVEQAETAAQGSDWKETTQLLRDIAERWKEIGPVDKNRNDALYQRLENARNTFFDRKRSHQEDQERDMLSNLDLKIELVEKAEKLANSEAWRETTEVFKQLTEEWKGIGRTMGEKNEELWNRFTAAKNVFYERKRGHFESIQQEQETNYAHKLELVEKAEAMQDSVDWPRTSQAYTDLMEDWKKTGRVPAEKADELWDRLCKAKEKFFAAKRQHFEAIRINLEDNQTRKMALVKRAEELRDSTQWREATEELNELMTEWKTVGPVPRGQSETIWERFIQARTSFFERKDADRVRRKERTEQRSESRKQQTRNFLKTLEEELAEEQTKLEDFQAGLEDITPGPKAEELRSHLTKLISQTEQKLKHKLQKLEEVRKQLEELEQSPNRDKVQEG